MSMQITDNFSLLNTIKSFDTFHDIIGENKQVKEAYQFLYQSLDSMSLHDFKERYKELQEILTENGVSYNLYEKNDPHVLRQWSVDMLPLAFTSKEWQKLERGLIQRAELFEHIFNDIYGKQTLLEKNIVPAKLLYTHGGYLRSCMNIYGDERNLFFHSADIVKGNDGNFYAYGDRVQAPSGGGYALENRLAISKLFPSLFRNAQVHRLIIYFRALRHIIAQRAKLNGQDGNAEPTIVFLTPGPASETYFEHTFLSAYLGYELVQGEDLVVINSKVYLRTLDGLRKVDAIIKRVDDLYCDPLELKGDSLLGVPGLMQAIRNRNVILANPIGSGVLENIGLLPYLNQACHHFFGEDLHIGNLETYWLGEEKNLHYVFEHFEEFCILPTYLASVNQIAYPCYLGKQEQNKLIIRIREKPDLFCAQKILPQNYCPVFSGNKIESGRYVLRTYAIANEQSFLIMPGALARVSTKPKDLTIMNQKGAISKDVWVISSEPEKESVTQDTERGETHEVIIEKTDKVPSRVAENLFWLGRYIERSENCARILRKSRELISDNSSLEYTGAWLNMVTDATYSYPGFYNINKKDFHLIENEISSLVFHSTTIGSLGYNLNNVVFTARNAFDRLSEDSVRLINKIEKNLQYTYHGDIGDYLDESIVSLSALSNNFSESMNQNSGWVLLLIGRRTERALFFIHLMRSFDKLNVPLQNLMLEHLLEVNNARNTYKRRYRHSANLQTVIDLLVFDEKNPRSLAFQIIQLNSLVNRLSSGGSSKKSEIERLLLKIISMYHLEQTKDEYIRGYQSLALLLPWLNEAFEGLSKVNQILQQQYFIQPETQSQVQSYTEADHD